MKVLIDDGLSTLQETGGIYNQSINLWKHLRTLIQCDITDYHYLKTFPRVARRAVYLGLTNLGPHQRQYDLIHYQNYYVPRSRGKAKGVTTIHDLAGLKSPDVYPAWYNAYFRRTLHQALVRSDAMITVSNAIRKQLLDAFPHMDESRVHVCYNGLRSVFFESRPVEEELDAIGLRPYSYFLCVGNLEVRKNLPFLLLQFAEARKRSLIAKDTKLVLVGQEGIGFKSFQHQISERDQIFRLGRISDEQLVTLYRFCKAFLFPSLYEGFGIPILEAMSQGAPILISNIPASLELHRRHNSRCFVFELDRKEMLAEMLSHLDQNSAHIADRLDYGDLTLYSYDHVAQEHVRIYAQILNGSKYGMLPKRT